MSDNLSPRVVFRREKTARVSFADNDAIQTVINYYVDDTPSSASSFKKSLNNNSNTTQFQQQVKSIEQINYEKDRQRSAEDKRRKKELEEAHLNEIETKARIKSAQSKKRKQSIENEKHKIEEDMMRRRLLQEKDKLYEFDSVKSSNKLPDVSLNSSQMKSKQSIQIISELTNTTVTTNKNSSKTIVLPMLKVLNKENSFVKQQDTGSLTPRIMVERDRIKSEEGVKLKSAMDNFKERKVKKENKENKHKNNVIEKVSVIKTKEEIEFEMRRLAEENAKKVAEIKAQKQKLLEVKKQNEYKIDHLKDRKEIKIRRIEEEEEKIREQEEQKRRVDEKNRRKEDKRAKKAAEMRAIQLAEEVARKRAEEERRLIEYEQSQRAAKLQQEKMLLVSHRFLLNDFKNVK